MQRHDSVAASQACPAGQRRPTPQVIPAPQGCVMVDPHATASGACAPVQVAVQAQRPSTQLSGAAQARPHAPQWARSVAVLTHATPQRVRPAEQPHAPPTQGWPAGHARPHPPQWEALVLVFTHAPAQSTVPPGQPQTPPTHDCPDAQERPQAPQFARSALRLTHAPPQSTVPAGQRQVPSTQARPDGHARSHAPQCATLLRVSASQPLAGLPSQSAKPVAQSRPQAPAEHVAVAWAPDGHARPQAPQLASALVVSASQPLEATRSQSPRPGLQAKLHAPAAQKRTASLRVGHTVAQVPQWSGSLAVSEHAPPQSVCPAEHAHVPLTHIPLAHARPQRPQFDGSVARLRHTPPHSFLAVAHSHAPLAHT